MIVLPHSVAMKAMNKVASHINEMQKLHEEYGAVFDLLINEQTAVKKEVDTMRLSILNPTYSPVTPTYISQSVLLFLFVSGGWPLDGGSFATLHCGVDQPPSLFGQEQKTPWFGCFW